MACRDDTGVRGRDVGTWRRAARAWWGLSTRGKVGTGLAAVLLGAALAGSVGGDAEPQEEHGLTVEPVAPETAPSDESLPPSLAPTPPPRTSPTPAPRAAETPTTDPSPSPSEPPEDAWPRGDDALVQRRDRVVGVVDGDTLDLADGTRVRLAIVDTPEVHGGVERCGREASEFTRDFVLSRDVVVLRPATAPVTDDFGRLLGEVVRVEDGESLNVALAAAGLGTVDERFTSEDPDLADRARAAATGAPTPACDGVAPSASPAAAPPPASSAHTGRTDGGWSCHPAYRECLPAASPDLDCADVGHQVVLLGGDDPWRLDGNSTTRTDGVGCESYPAWSAGSTYPYE